MVLFVFLWTYGWMIPLAYGMPLEYGMLTQGFGTAVLLAWAVAVQHYEGAEEGSFLLIASMTGVVGVFYPIFMPLLALSDPQLAKFMHTVRVWRIASDASL